MSSAQVADRDTSISVVDVYAFESAGVYCRPGCGLPPGEEARYPLAASAEAAGMRACQLCRPYRFAQTIGAEAPELVCRAIRLIVAGALDDGSEAALAARLGLSGRHLRRLFLSQIGVTPDGLARSCRAHFARRLLDDTELSVTEIAFAAGYGSARQFNREFQRIFRGTPSQLRASGSAPGRLAAEDGLTLRLWFAGLLDWDALLRFLATRAVPGVEAVDGPIYRRTISADGDAGLLELWPGGPNHLNLRVHFAHWERLLHVAALARRIASLDDDPAVPSGTLAADKLIGPLLSARPGVRVPGTWDPFEVSVAAIIDQQGASARQVLGRLVSRLGRPVSGAGQFGLTHLFPPPPAFGSAGAELRAAGLTAEQAGTVAAFAASVSRGAIRLDGTTSAEQLIASIGAVPGISWSTAQYIALRMGEPDAFPVDDHTLRQTLGELRAVPALGHRWRPWRSYAAAHLWAMA